MLTPEQLQEIPEPIMKKYRQIENEILEEIARGLSDELKAGQGYRADILLRADNDIRAINKELAKKTGRTTKEIEKIMKQAVERGYIEEQELYKKGNKNLPPLKNNPVALNFVNAGLRTTRNEFENLSNTMGIVMDNRGVNLTRYYKSRIDYGIMQMSTGAFTYEDVTYKIMRELSSSGIRSVDYESGYTMSMDSAARMHIRTGLSQITGNISLNNAEIMGQDLMEITAHADSRPDHAEWQGEIVSLSGRRGYLSLDDIGHGSVAGFKGANCRHDWFPYFEGVSEPAYTRRMLKEASEIVLVDNGREMTAYDVSQRQRQIERRIRGTHKEIAVFTGAGLKDDVDFARAKLQRQMNLYKDFSNSAGIRTKYERI